MDIDSDSNSDSDSDGMDIDDLAADADVIAAQLLANCTAAFTADDAPAVDAPVERPPICTACLVHNEHRRALRLCTNAVCDRGLPWSAVRRVPLEALRGLSLLDLLLPPSPALPRSAHTVYAAGPADGRTQYCLSPRGVHGAARGGAACCVLG